MKVDAILGTKGRDVKTVSPSATLGTVAQRLRLERIGALVVLDDSRLVGMVSERDIVYAFAAQRDGTVDVKVADVMSRNVITCDANDSLTRVLGLMTRHRVRHIPVVRAGQLSGLISIGDVVKHRLDELEMEAAILRDSYLAGH